MNFIEKVKEIARSNMKKIIVTEAYDERVLNAVKEVIKEGFADMIIIGSEVVEGATSINPIESNYLDKFTNDLYELRKDKGMTLEEARSLLINDNMYFACMMVKEGLADGIVSGAAHTSANTIRPALQIIKAKEESKLVSAIFLMDIPGYNNIFLFGDCALNPNPTSEELAYIAIESSKTYKKLVGNEPITAMLSYSSFSSAKGELVDKVNKAVKIAKSLNNDLIIDGEMQLDTAIDASVAKIKGPNSRVSGNANVLIFPDLNSGNIGYKLVNRFAKAKAYGPLLQGINNPVNDLSRGSSTEDIVGTIALTCLEAIDR